MDEKGNGTDGEDKPPKILMKAFSTFQSSSWIWSQVLEEKGVGKDRAKATRKRSESDASQKLEDLSSGRRIKFEDLIN